MEYFQVLLPLGLIILLSKLLSIGSKKMGMPQVVGMLVAGLLLGLIKFIPGQTVFTSDTLNGLSFLAEIGVILIMFSAGIETDLKQLKQTGVAAIVITSLGVIVPLGLGFVVSTAFHGGFTNISYDKLIDNLFYGTILSATSVSITVATLKELGKLNSRVGSAIVTAAVLDDIIGIVLLSMFIGMKNSTGGATTGIVVGKVFGFLAVAIVLGIGLNYIMKKLCLKYKNKRRIPIFCFAICFFYAWAAEQLFGVADITGAYIAGIVMSNLTEREFVDQKVEVSNYLIFAPVFFANIGIQADFSGLNIAILGFGAAYIAVGFLSKMIGCGAGALMCGFNFKDSYRIGLGMVVRGEVLLVCAEKGVVGGIVTPDIMPIILILIILTSLIPPVLLKLSYRKENQLTPPPDGSQPIEGDVIPFENNTLECDDPTVIDPVA